MKKVITFTIEVAIEAPERLLEQVARVVQTEVEKLLDTGLQDAEDMTQEHVDTTGISARLGDDEEIEIDITYTRGEGCVED